MDDPDPTQPPVLIVAHGSPSDPEPQEAALQALAARVEALCPGRRIRGATLAAPGRFEAEVATLGTPALYPFFMARGWFTGKVLAQKAEPLGLTRLAPFGTEPELPDCAASALLRTLRAQGWTARESTLLVAAHGSAVSRGSARATHAFTEALQTRMRFADTCCGFVEEAPYLAEVARDLGQAICLPFFALRAGHMVDDVPEALEEARFEGPVLAPFIDWPETPALIARSLSGQAAGPGL